MQPNGQAKQTVAKYAAEDNVQYAQYSPTGIYIGDNPDSQTKYYDYQIGNAGATSISLTAQQFSKDYSYYYYSPDGQKTMWSEVRDGKHTVLVGDQQGANAKPVVDLSTLDAYGWYDNDHVLLSKDNNELYIVSASGGTPFKVTDYESSNSPGFESYGSGGRGGGGY